MFKRKPLSCRVGLKMGRRTCVAFVCVFCRCAAWQRCQSCTSLPANPQGNGDGIPVTMAMSKLICHTISTWERLIQGKLLIYSRRWILACFFVRSDVWLRWLARVTAAVCSCFSHRIKLKDVVCFPSTHQGPIAAKYPPQPENRLQLY